MSNDPDFHDCAAAWLDASGDDTRHRVLREILRDSPDAAAEFASLARTDAALHLAGLTIDERRRRARALLQPPLAFRVRRFISRPAFRWSAAVAVAAVIGTVCWLMTAGGKLPAESKKPRIAGGMQREAAPRPLQTTAAPDKLPPGDKDFVRRMSRFVIPDFRVANVPLPAALDALRKNIAVIDASAVPDFSAVKGLSESLTVNLSIAYRPVATILDFIAIQTGTRMQASGRGYVVLADPEAPMPGATMRGSYSLSPEDSLQNMSLSLSPELLQIELATKLGERPVRAEAVEQTIEVTASERMHRLLQKLLAGTGASPPGTWVCEVRVVRTKSPAAREKLMALGEFHRFSKPEFDVFLRELNQMKGVDILTMPASSVPPGFAEENCDLMKTPDPDNISDDWTGFKIEMINHPAGDVGGQADFAFYAQEPDESSGERQLRRFQSQVALELNDGSTQKLASYSLPGGSLMAVFVSGERDPAREELPYGIPVVGKKGFVYSPYAEDKGMVDVEGMNRGTRLQCPYTGKHFRVP
jgi:hypothetical protein